MGCDIHMYCEAKKTLNGKPQWVNADHWRLNKYFGVFDDDEGEEYEVVSLYSSRNYELFNALAGVRGGKGNPICSEPKGLPNDVTKQVAAASDRWNGDGHSHSYLTLQELIDFSAKTGTTIKRSGMISLEQAKELDENGAKPNSWCAFTTNQTFVCRDWEDESMALSDLVSAVAERMKKTFWVFGDEYDQELNEKFRIVFWFDN